MLDSVKFYQEKKPEKGYKILSNHNIGIIHRNYQATLLKGSNSARTLRRSVSKDVQLLARETTNVNALR